MGACASGKYGIGMQCGRIHGSKDMLLMSWCGTREDTFRETRGHLLELFVGREEPV